MFVGKGVVSGQVRRNCILANNSQPVSNEMLPFAMKYAVQEKDGLSLQRCLSGLTLFGVRFAMDGCLADASFYKQNYANVFDDWQFDFALNHFGGELPKGRLNIASFAFHSWEGC